MAFAGSEKARTISMKPQSPMQTRLSVGSKKTTRRAWIVRGCLRMGMHPAGKHLGHVLPCRGSPEFNDVAPCSRFDRVGELT